MTNRKLFFNHKFFLFMAVFFVMLFFAMRVEAAVDTDGLTQVIDETFDTMTTETLKESWSVGNYAEVVKKPNPPAGSTARDLALRGQAQNSNQKVKPSMEWLSGRVVISFDLWVERMPSGQAKLPEIIASSGAFLTMLNLDVNTANNTAAGVNIPYEKTRVRDYTSTKIKGWTHFDFVLSTDTDRFSAYINGSRVVNEKPFWDNRAADYISVVQWYPIAENNTAYAIDNLKIYAEKVGAESEKPDYAADIDTKADSYTLTDSLAAHPRILVNDFDALRTELQSDPDLAQRYRTIKTETDKYLSQKPLALPQNYDKSSILSYARMAEDRCFALSLVYQIEQDPKYLECLWKNVENIANYETWMPSSFLSVAEFTVALSIVYDWNFQDLTEVQKKVIRDAVFRQSLYYGIDFYQGITHGSTNFYRATHNWNIVCNMSLIVAGLTFGDEFPNIAELIFKESGNSLWRALKMYAPGGAWGEGVMYWRYATNFLALGAGSMATAFRTGTVLPDYLRVTEAEGVSQTAEYEIYMSGKTGTFNYGDASLELASSQAAAWAARQFREPRYLKHYLEFYNVNATSGGLRGKVQNFLFYDGSLKEEGSYLPLDKAYVGAGTSNDMMFRDSWSNDSGVYLGVRGGYNKINHGSLSMGTFVLDIAKKRWAQCLPTGDYDWPGYFNTNGQRYQYYINGAEGQNTLLLEPDGSYGQVIDTTSYVHRAEFGVSNTYGITDMTAGYANRASRVLRGVRLFGERSKVLIQDEVTADTAQETWWFMHTPAESVTISSDGKHAILYQGGERLYAQIVAGPKDSTFYWMDAKPFPISPNPAGQQSRNYGAKLAVHSMGQAGTMRLAVELYLLSPGENPRMEKAAGIEPLDAWTMTEEADASEVALKANESILLLKNSPQMLAYGRKCLLDESNSNVAVAEQDGKVFVPIKALVSQLHMVTSYKETSKLITLQTRRGTIELPTSGTTIKADGVSQTISTALVKKNGVFMMALQDLADVLNYKTRILDSGVIVLGAEDISFLNTKALEDEAFALLDYQLWADGRLLSFFRPDRTEYEAVYPNGSSVSEVTLVTSSGTVRAVCEDDTATLTLHGMQYRIHFTPAAMPESESVAVQGIHGYAAETAEVAPTEQSAFAVGDTAQIVAVAYDKDGNTLPEAAHVLMAASKTPELAEVSGDGTLRFLAVGEAEISVMAEVGQSVRMDTFRVSVEARKGFRVEDVSYYTDGGKPISDLTAIENAKLAAEIQLSSVDAADEVLAVYCAAYDADGRLLKVKTDRVQGTQAETTTPVRLELELGDCIRELARVETYFWTDAMRPLCRIDSLN